MSKKNKQKLMDTDNSMVDAQRKGGKRHGKG